MIDYDLPLMEYDLREMKAKAFVIPDKNGNEHVKFRDLLDSVKPRNSV